MKKTAVYTPVNGDMAHLKLQLEVVVVTTLSTTWYPKSHLAVVVCNLPLLHLYEIVCKL